MGFKITLKNISTLCFLLLWSVQETTCFIKKHKLIEFQEKLQEMVASSSPIPPPSPAVSQTKQSGRVFYPIGYGADPTGVQDSGDAILNALNDAFQVQNGLQLLPGVNDLGGVVIDLQGGNYKISMPLRFPASGGGNVVVKGGTLRASDIFPGDRHLIEVWSQNSQVLDKRNKVHDPNGFPAGKLQNGAILYEDITFRDILFDSGYRGGGIFVVNSARIRINNCFFLHFTTEGILVQGGHETFISSCFLGQHSTVGGDPGERNFSGTAIDLGSNDNAITDVALFSAAIGVLLRGQANILTGIHCYNKATGFGGVGIMVKLYASLTRIDNCYLDYNSIVMEDPVQVHVTNGLFLGEGNIVLKAINGKISGVNIVNNMFNADPKGTTPIVGLDGTFTSVDQVLIDQNDVVSGMKYKSTVGKLTVAGNATKWVADFSSVLLFPNQINHFQYSFYIHGMPNGFPNHAITNVSNNVVVVESDKLVNAVVSVIVDQCNMAGESKI
ncbi:polygalacturonase QRT3-like [Populus alba x Populus x berolinensis]|nr:polygalacturonase QRT3-like [Populus alba x Populus x berolinensis]